MCRPGGTGSERFTSGITGGVTTPHFTPIGVRMAHGAREDRG